MIRKLLVKRILLFLLMFIFIIVIGSCSYKIQYSLSITNEGEGTVDPSKGIHKYNEDTVVSLSAIPDTANGWIFKEWGGPDGSDVSENKLLINEDKSITAIFSKSEYSLNVRVTPENSGEVDKVILSNVQDIEHGEAVRLTANANNGYVFDHWEGELNGSENPATLSMDGDKDITAVFVQEEYSLDITAENGTVTKDPDQLDYTYGSTVKLQAAPDSGYVFDHWEEELSGNSNPVDITMDGSKSVKAVFVKAKYNLDISIDPVNTGGEVLLTVKDDLGLEYGQILTLRAVPEAGYEFDHWEGDLTGSTNPVDLTMDSDKIVKAVFTALSYELNQSVYPANSGTITTDPVKAGGYGYGETVTVTASPATGYRFDHWEGDLPASADPTATSQQLIMDGTKNLIALFVRQEYKLTVTASPVEGGTIEKVILPSVQNIEHGENVRLTVNINPGYGFDHWQGDLSGSDNPAVLTMDGNKDITAVFFAKEIYGRVTGSSSLEGYEGIAINFSDGSSTTTDRQGYWSKIIDNTITVTPGDSNIYFGGIFTPESREVSWPDDNVNFSFNGYKLKMKWGTSGNGDGEFDKPSDLAMDSTGNIYVVDTENNRIQVFDSNGDFLRKWGSEGTADGQFDSPYGIFVDSADNVYVADTSNDRIQVFDNTGNFIRKWGTSASPYGYEDGQFSNPSDIAMDTDGNIYVPDEYRVQVFDNAGNFIRKFNNRVGGGLAGITISSGNIYVADNWKIQIFDNTYSLIKEWADSGLGIASDNSGNIFVAGFGDYHITEFDSAGSFIRKWGRPGSNDGQFDFPLGIAIDNSGNIYVTDSNNNRIQVFEPVD